MNTVAVGMSAGGFVVVMGTFFLWVVTQRKTPIGDLQLDVGDKLLPFEAGTSEGTRFTTAELAGKRTLSTRTASSGGLTRPTRLLFLWRCQVIT